MNEQFMQNSLIFLNLFSKKLFFRTEIIKKKLLLLQNSNYYFLLLSIQIYQTISYSTERSRFATATR